MDWNTLSRAEIEALIESWIFSERDRRIIHRRLIDGIRIETLSFEFDLSVSQIKRIITKCKERLISHCW